VEFYTQRGSYGDLEIAATIIKTGLQTKENAKGEFVMGHRVIGKRRERELGPLREPTAEEKSWLAEAAFRRTRVPKGIYRYRTQAEANADWERWHAELVTEAADAFNDDHPKG
jgi:hypothetical protein